MMMIRLHVGIWIYEGADDNDNKLCTHDKKWYCGQKPRQNLHTHSSFAWWKEVFMQTLWWKPWQLCLVRRCRILAHSTRSCPIPIQTWSQHFSRLLFRSNLSELKAELAYTTINEHNLILNAPFSEHEILEPVNSTQNHKAAGPDSLSYEHLKDSICILLPLWIQLFNKCLESGTIPKLWRTSTISVLYKSKGSISKQCCSYKVFCKILANRIYSHCTHAIPNEQFGFLRHRSELDAVDIMLTYIHDSVYKCSIPVYAIFLDYRKAFDSIDRQSIIDTLVHFNVSGPILSLILDLLRYNIVSIFDGVQISDPIIQNTGVPSSRRFVKSFFVCYVYFPAYYRLQN